MEGLGNANPTSAIDDRLRQASALEQGARATCRGGDTKRTRKQLKATFRKLKRVRALLSSKGGRKLPGSAALLAEVDGVRRDLKSLKGAVQCPRDATPQ